MNNLAIRLRGVSKTYRYFSLEGIDLDVPEGLSREQMMDSWNYVWRERHGSAAGELPAALMARASELAGASSDWWRQVGAIAVRDGREPAFQARDPEPESGTPTTSDVVESVPSA